MRTLPFLRDGHMIIFHVDVFPFFAGFPRYDNILPSSASFRSANTPFLGFFGVFPSHTHIYITDSCFPSSDVLSFRWCFPLLITRTGFRHWFLPRRFPERLQSVAGVAPSLGYLLLFLTVCPHKQNGGLLFLLLWYGGEGRGGGGCTAILGVKGRREGGGEEEGSLRGCSGLSVNRFCALLPVSDFNL